MVREEGGRWDVSIKDDAVYLERVSQDDERLFDESLASDEARDLAELLTKFADKLDRSEKSKDSDDEDDENKDHDDEDDEDDEDEDDEDDDKD
ncbi:hypothetical protein A5692_26405 [Mycobacterium sp. E342]|uniref:hypothetical protein n=1 Tax=Mycobacterium sp. E342 TaxID=1834147 RepID=UPI0007FC4B71|nr:hypothetical protein [Mycobacterium sp. E342]OBH26750.1 hypothetical protein A5692_26405 [Mycobacterium sp. E342]